MPWLSRQNSTDFGSKQNPDTNEETTHHHRQKHSQHHQAHRPKRIGNVSFIPAQIDGLCGTYPSSQKQTPTRLFLRDIQMLIQNLSYMPSMVVSLFTQNARRSILTISGLRETILHCVLAVSQMWMLAIAVPVFMCLPGFMAILCMGACWAFTAMCSWSLDMDRFGGKRSRVVMTGREMGQAMPSATEDERWIYVNGMMCSNRSLLSQCARISQIFKRPVIGIHNRTNGLVVDMFETLLQRSFSIQTRCTRNLTSQIRDACLNNSVRKVILLGHGTGALQISLALDRLHADLPVDVLSKLEIYTFGSAAAHLNNPVLRIDSISNSTCGVSGNQAKFTRPDGSIASPVKATLASLGHRVEDHERVIPHVEHYALGSDLVARVGVLHHVRNVLDNRFCGRVFVLNEKSHSHGSAKAQTKTKTKGAKAMAKSWMPFGNAAKGGFLMNEHYLELLFPTGSHSRSSTHSEQSHDVHISMLDNIVSVDMETAEKREFTAQGVAPPLKSMGMPMSMPMPHASQAYSSLNGMMGGFNGNGAHTNGVNSAASSASSSPDISPRSSTKREKRSSWGTAGAMGIDGVGKARFGAKECEGRSVRQLSRLWRYVDGARPVGEGVAVMNGVGSGEGHGSGNGLDNGVGGGDANGNNNGRMMNHGNAMGMM